MSEDVLSSIQAIKKLGAKVSIKTTFAKYMVLALKVINTKLTIDVQNSGTLGRLISGILIDTPFPIKIVGDKVCQKRF